MEGLADSRIGVFMIWACEHGRTTGQFYSNLLLKLIKECLRTPYIASVHIARKCFQFRAAMAETDCLTIPADLKISLNKLLKEKNEHIGVATVWNDIVALLLQHHCGYYMTLHTDDVMVHPRNRGGRGLNHHNVHRWRCSKKQAPTCPS